MISDKTILELQKAVKTETIDIGGVTYATNPVHDVRKADPVAGTLEIHTLTGLADYYVSRDFDLKDEAKGAPFLHVVSHAEVKLHSNLFGRFRQRETFAVCAFETLIGKGFQFGQFLDCESFIIFLQTLFVADAERNALLNFLGSIREENVKTNQDDGVTQTVTARSGIARVSEVKVPNPVTLRPYRTFREIEQPASQFILRMKTADKSDKPLCALLEADGGKWKLEAIHGIWAFLSEKLPDVKVIA